MAANWVPSVIVNVDGNPSRSVGSLKVRAVASTIQRRTGEDEHCAALVEALALLVALEFDHLDGQRSQQAHRDSSATNRQNSQAESARGATRDIGYELRLALGAGLDPAPAPRLLPSGAPHVFFGCQENQCLLNQLTFAVDK
jgi:hypothetical protein